MNKVELIGRLTIKPELKYTNSNKAYTRFSLAVNRGYGENKSTDFINCVAWEKRAETLANYTDKGHQLGIVGNIQTGQYTDKDGNNRKTTDVVVEEIHFIEKKDSKDVSPSDFENMSSSQVVAKVMEDDPFQDFHDTVVIDDSNFLD